MNEIFESTTSKAFIQSVSTRWWSEFNSIERVVEIGLDKVVESQQKLGLTPFTQSDFKFLESFLQVMKPVVTAMKILEGETTTYIGQIIPTVMGLERKLQVCTDSAMKPLAEAMLQGLAERFGPVKEMKEYKIAAMPHPKFRLNFLEEIAKVQHRQMLENYIKEVHQHASNAAPARASSSTSSVSEGDADDLYGFMASQTTSDIVVNDQVCDITRSLT